MREMFGPVELLLTEYNGGLIIRQVGYRRL